MHWLFTIACEVGVAVSVYAVYVEKKVKEDAEYVAMCDFTPAVSCSKVFGHNEMEGKGVDAIVVISVFNCILFCLFNCMDFGCCNCMHRSCLRVMEGRCRIMRLCLKVIC